MNVKLVSSIGCICVLVLVGCGSPAVAVPGAVEEAPLVVTVPVQPPVPTAEAPPFHGEPTGGQLAAPVPEGWQTFVTGWPDRLAGNEEVGAALDSILAGFEFAR